jgi:hypothetical protein
VRAIVSWHQHHLDAVCTPESTVSGQTPGAASQSSSSVTTSLSNPDTLVQPDGNNTLLSADPLLFQGAVFGDIGGTLDYSVLDVLFDGQLRPLDSFMSGM